MILLRAASLRHLGDERVQYLGGKADVGKRIAQECAKRLTPGSLFVDMFGTGRV